MDNNQTPKQPQEVKNTPAIVALVLGIIGIVGSIIPGGGIFKMILGLVLLACSILAIVYGAKGMKLAKVSGQGKGLAIAGLVLGIVSVALTAIGVICTICTIIAAGALFGSMISAFIIF